jgi:hypothetical protein
VTLSPDRLRELRDIYHQGLEGMVMDFNEARLVIDELIAAREAAVATDAEVEAAIDAFHHANRKRDVEAARAKLRSLFRQQPAPRLTFNEAVIEAWRSKVQGMLTDEILDGAQVLNSNPPQGHTLGEWDAVLNEACALMRTQPQQPAPDLLAACDAIVNLDWEKAFTLLASEPVWRGHVPIVVCDAVDALRAAVERARKEKP